jgi:hypothetical protein
MAKSTTDRADQDSPWKLVLRQYFPEAIEFFFPDIAKIVDWTKPIEFLETEFQKIAPDAEIGRRFADQLVKVYRKNGKAIILLIHIEIQAAPEKDFPERMFTYAIRIFEYFHQFPVTGQCKVIDAPKMLHQSSNSMVSRGVNQLILSASN